MNPSGEVRDSTDLLAAATNAVGSFLDRLCAQPETISVALLSSSSALGPIRSFDMDSDFDISVMVTVPEWRASFWRPTQQESLQVLQAEVPDWLPSFSFHVGVPWGE